MWPLSLLPSCGSRHQNRTNAMPAGTCRACLTRERARTVSGCKMATQVGPKVHIYINIPQSITIPRCVWYDSYSHINYMFKWISGAIWYVLCWCTIKANQNKTTKNQNNLSDVDRSVDWHSLPPSPSKVQNHVSCIAHLSSVQNNSHICSAKVSFCFYLMSFSFANNVLFRHFLIDIREIASKLKIPQYIICVTCNCT